MPRVVVAGDLMVVTVGGVDRMPRPGENVLLRDPAVFASGVGANVAMSLRAMGLDVVLASAVGDDAAGDRVVAELAAAGVDVGSIRRRGGAATGSMVVMVDPTGERTMVGTRGASERFDLDPGAVLNAAGPVDWLHVSGYLLLDAEMEGRCVALAAAAASDGIPVSIDLEGIATTGRRTRLDGHLVLGNHDECLAYFGTYDEDVLVAERTGRLPLVVKAGADGCLLVTDREAVPIRAAEHVEANDSTGAGDAFDAAFIAARLRGQSLRASCVEANAAGRAAVTARGPRVVPA